MTDAELLRRIELSPKLEGLRAKLYDEVNFRAPISAQFDPILILTLVSVMLQAIAFCHERNNPKELFADLRSARMIHNSRQRRVRRALRRFCQDRTDLPYGSRFDTTIYESVVDLIESATDDELQEIIAISKEYAEANKINGEED